MIAYDVLLTRLWKGIKRRLLGFGLDFLFWSPIYERLQRSWLGVSLLAAMGLAYYADEPDKVNQILDYFDRIDG